MLIEIMVFYLFSKMNSSSYFKGAFFHSRDECIDSIKYDIIYRTCDDKILFPISIKDSIINIYFKKTFLTLLNFVLLLFFHFALE